MILKSNEKKSGKAIAAYHEAGHAVMFFLLGYKVESITIDQYGNGYTKSPIQLPSAFVTPLNSSQEKIGAEAYESVLHNLRISFRKYALINYAGYCAEFKFQNKKMPWGLRAEGNSENDISKIVSEVENVNALYGKVIFPELYYYFWCKEAKYIIRRPKVWETIVELAEALLNSSNGTLKSRAIKTIFTKRLKPYSFRKWLR